MIVAPAATAASGMRRRALCWPMTSSIRYLDVQGRTNPARRFTTMSAMPMTSDARCSATSSRASFQARPLSYLAMRRNIGRVSCDMRSRSVIVSAALAAALPTTAFAQDPPPIAREFRAAWVATVANIDWPSKPGLSTWDQQRELLAILDKAAALKLNAIVFHIRPGADALYA